MNTAEVVNTGKDKENEDKTTLQLMNGYGECYSALDSVRGDDPKRVDLRSEIAKEMSKFYIEIQCRIHNPKYRDESKPTWSKGLSKP